MDKTRKVISGSALEWMLVFRLLVPLFAGAALCFLQYASDNFPGRDLPLLSSILTYFIYAGSALLVLVYLCWFLFILQVWFGLFPKHKWIPFLFFPSFLPIAGPFVFLPCALLIPAKKREGNAFLWNLLLILLVAVFQLQLLAAAFPITERFLSKPHTMNLIACTAALILVTAFPAYRLLAGRRIGSRCVRFCMLIVVLIGCEYTYSIVHVRESDERLENAKASLTALHVPSDMNRLRDFYRNGVPYSEDYSRLTDLRKKIQLPLPELSNDPKEISAALLPFKADLEKLDAILTNPVPLKSASAYRLADQYEAFSTNVSLIARLYNLRIRLAVLEKHPEQILPLAHLQTNLFRTPADECRGSANFGSALVRRAKTFEHVFSSGLKFSQAELSEFASMFQRDEQMLRDAFHRACLEDAAAHDFLSSNMYDVPYFKIRCFKFIPNMRNSKYLLGAAWWDLVSADRAFMFERFDAFLRIAPWTKDYSQIADALAALRCDKDTWPAFRLYSRIYTSQFENRTLLLNRHISILRMASAASEIECFRLTHKGAPPDSLDLLGDIRHDPLTGKPFLYEKTAKGYRLTGQDVQISPNHPVSNPVFEVANP